MIMIVSVLQFSCSFQLFHDLLRPGHNCAMPAWSRGGFFYVGV
jgi:hypothetical protein